MEQHEKYYIQLNDVEAYKIAFKLSNYVWNAVVLWDRFPRDTVGCQFVRALDSVSANIAEGFGRYHKNHTNHTNHIYHTNHINHSNHINYSNHTNHTKSWHNN